MVDITAHFHGIQNSHFTRPTLRVNCSPQAGGSDRGRTREFICFSYK